MKHRRIGQSPNKIVLHGGPGAIGSAKGLVDVLDDVIELYSEGQSIEEQLHEIRSLIDLYEMKNPILIGHSWGAWLAYLYAARYPVSKLILVGCGAFKVNYLEGMHKKRQAKLSEKESEEVNKIFASLQSGQVPSDISRMNILMAKLDSYDMLPVSDQLIEFDYQGHQSLMKEINTLRSSGRLLKEGLKIKTQVTIIHGIEDPHPLEGITQPFDEIGLNYETFLLEKCGHTPWYERWAYKEFETLINKESKYLFKSERLGFRFFTMNDLDDFAKMNADPEVMDYFPSVLNRGESEKFLHRIVSAYDQGFGLYAVELLDSRTFIGFIGLSNPTFKADFMPCVEIGWRLMKDYWRQGYASEGAKRVLDHAKVIGLNEIVSFTASINTPSIGVMKKIGLRFERLFDHPNVNGERLKEHVLYRRQL